MGNEPKNDLTEAKDGLAEVKDGLAEAKDDAAEADATEDKDESAKAEDDTAETEDDSAEAKDNLSGNSEDSSSEPKAGKRKEKERKLASKVAGRTRFTASVPSTGLLIASVVMAIGTIVNLVVTSFEFVIGEISLHDLTVEYVEYADSFLLAVALYILSIGLTSLFISDRIPLPKWLEFHDFDDLKERLTSVIIVMIGVFFLGHVLKEPPSINTLWLGLGCAVIIIALSVFLRTVFKSDD